MIAAGTWTGIADRINTGTADPDISRALIVFNLTGEPVSGVAVFHADMSWPRGIPLPPVAICELHGGAAPSVLTDLRDGPDRNERLDRVQLTFDLRFAVRDVPARGWRTYVAAYTTTAVPDASNALAAASPHLIVVETLRHAGDLPPVGTL